MKELRCSLLLISLLICGIQGGGEANETKSPATAPTAATAAPTAPTEPPTTKKTPSAPIQVKTKVATLKVTKARKPIKKTTEAATTPRPTTAEKAISTTTELKTTSIEKTTIITTKKQPPPVPIAMSTTTPEESTKTNTTPAASESTKYEPYSNEVCIEKWEENIQSTASWMDLMISLFVCPITSIVIIVCTVLINKKLLKKMEIEVVEGRNSLFETIDGVLVASIPNEVTEMFKVHMKGGGSAVNTPVSIPPTGFKT